MPPLGLQASATWPGDEQMCCSWPLLNDSAGYYEATDWTTVALLARLDGGDGNQAELCVRADDDLLRRFSEEVPGELARICGHSEIADELTEIIGTRVRLCARVDAVDGERGLVVFSLYFRADEYVGNLRSYYLVYNSAAASLSLLPQLPRRCPAVYDKRPLLVRRDDGRYSLVLMANSSEQRTDDLLVRPVICQWSPPTPQSLSRDDHDKGDGICPWRMRLLRQLCPVPISFQISAQVFTCKGKAFWADLKQGLLYCDCADLLNDGDGMEFIYVALPEEYRVEELEYNGRTMGGGVGDSVWFVVIESYEHPGDTTVVVWSLDLSSGTERRWERHRELSLLSIWAMQGFVEAGLRRRVPWSPFLREQDAGVLYFLLPLADEKSERGCHLIGIDVGSSSEPRVLPPRRLPDIPCLHLSAISCSWFPKHQETAVQLEDLES